MPNSLSPQPPAFDQLHGDFAFNCTPSDNAFDASPYILKPVLNCSIFTHISAKVFGGLIGSDQLSVSNYRCHKSESCGPTQNNRLTSRVSDLSPSLHVQHYLASHNCSKPAPASTQALHLHVKFLENVSGAEDLVDGRHGYEGREVSRLHRRCRCHDGT